MDLLRAWDIAVFRWVNQDLGNPVFDVLMPFLSGNAFFVPGLVLVAVGLLVRGGPRGLVFVLMLGAAAGITNEFVVETLKDAVARPRPYAALSDVILRVGKGNPNASMPSGHSMNAALMASFVAFYYPRVLFAALPIALGVAVSRIYNGVHFPTDVLTGLSIGVLSAVILVYGADRVWRKWGPRWAPAWVRRVPSLRRPPRSWNPGEASTGGDAP